MRKVNEFQNQKIANWLGLVDPKSSSEDRTILSGFVGDVNSVTPVVTPSVGLKVTRNGGITNGSIVEAQKVGEAFNVADAPKLSNKLTIQSANAPFAANGTLTQDAINGAKPIPGYEAGRLSNPAIPPGFGKYSTDSFRSPAGDFTMHFYMNPNTGQIYYGLDYKAVFNKMSGVPKKP